MQDWNSLFTATVKYVESRLCVDQIDRERRGRGRKGEREREREREREEERETHFGNIFNWFSRSSKICSFVSLGRRRAILQ